MIKVDEYQMRIRALRTVLAETAEALELESLKTRLAEIWQNLENPQKSVGKSAPWKTRWARLIKPAKAWKIPKPCYN